MNSQKTIIALAVVVAVLALGVAYAAITNQTLTIEGNVSTSVSDANFDVHFTGTPTTGGAGKTVAGINGTNSKKATIDVSGLTTAGQAATATYTISNASPQDVAAKLTKSVTHSNNTWFTVTAELADDTLEKGETTTITVTVTLLDTPVTDDDLDAAKDTITVTIDAEAQ